MAKSILIFGAGGFAREVLEIIRDINAEEYVWEVRGFVVDAGIDAPAMLKGYPVLTGVNAIAACEGAHVIVAVGSSKSRKVIVEKIRASCTNPFATLIHPRAWIGSDVKIGEGSVICAGAMLTTDINIGKHVHVNLGCTIGHDVNLRDYVSLNPRVSVSGNVDVGVGNEIGTGAVLIPNISIGEWSLIGAGSVAIKSLDPYVTAVGAPARVIKVRGGQ